MPRQMRTHRPSGLSDSWATEDYQDEPSSASSQEDASSLDSEVFDTTEATDVHTPLRSPVGSKPISPTSVKTSASQTNTTRRQTSRETTPVRRSPRTSSRGNSVEPSFIMPSMSEDNADGSWVQSSSLGASKVRHRKAPPSSSRLGASSKLSPKVRKTRALNDSVAQAVEEYATRRRASERASVHSSKHNDKAPARPEEQPFLILQQLWGLISPILSYTTSIAGMILHMLKPLFALLIVAYGVIMALQVFSTTITNALSPLCSIPGTSYILPFCESTNTYAPSVEFDQLIDAQSAFEDVLSSSTEIASLPYNMKRSEASIRDLRSVIQYSSLPSRNEIAFEFSGFIENARQASADLSNFDSRIARAVDAILSTNRWTLSVLSSIEHGEAARGSISRFVDTINPFASPLSNQEKVLSQYLRHTGAVQDQVATVILEAQGLLILLNSLDERLDVIASIATRDGVSVKDSRDELLLSLWTRLGGNRSSMQKIEDHLKLLRSVNSYQRAAWNHVSATILKLQEISAQLEDLRERVAAPGVVGVRADLPLQVHIEHIQLGLDRLEAVRGESRRVQSGLYRQMVAAGDKADGKLSEDMAVTVSAVGHK